MSRKLPDMLENTIAKIREMVDVNSVIGEPIVAGDVTIINLAPMNDSFTLIICPGEMLDCGLENGAYKRATQGWFKPAKPLPQFLKEYSLHGGTHHSAMVYDVDIEELKAFGSMMGFDVVVIE